jgi:hypothetical protein
VDVLTILFFFIPFTTELFFTPQSFFPCPGSLGSDPKKPFDTESNFEKYKVKDLSWIRIPGSRRPFGPRDDDDRSSLRAPQGRGSPEK